MDRGLRYAGTQTYATRAVRQLMQFARQHAIVNILVNYIMSQMDIADNQAAVFMRQVVFSMVVVGHAAIAVVDEKLRVLAPTEYMGVSADTTDVFYQPWQVDRPEWQDPFPCDIIAYPIWDEDRRGLDAFGPAMTFLSPANGLPAIDGMPPSPLMQVLYNYYDDTLNLHARFLHDRTYFAGRNDVMVLTTLTSPVGVRQMSLSATAPHNAAVTRVLDHVYGSTVPHHMDRVRSFNSDANARGRLPLGQDDTSPFIDPTLTTVAGSSAQFAPNAAPTKDDTDAVPRHIYTTLLHSFGISPELVGMVPEGHRSAHHNLEKLAQTEREMAGWARVLTHVANVYHAAMEVREIAKYVVAPINMPKIVRVRLKLETLMVTAPMLKREAIARSLKVITNGFITEDDIREDVDAKDPALSHDATVPMNRSMT